MKRVYLLGAGVIFFLTGYSGTGVAKTVRYYDEKGQVHYVNTRYKKVPERYRWQVEDQLAEESKALETGEQSAVDQVNGDNPPAPAGEAGRENVVGTPGSEVPVILYVEAGCNDCRRQEMLLNIGKIPFRKHQLDCPTCTEGVPRQVLKSPTLPVTQVGDGVFVTGINIRDVRWAVDKAKTPKP